jgi:hypothetical protein
MKSSAGLWIIFGLFLITWAPAIAWNLWNRRG